MQVLEIPESFQKPRSPSSPTHNLAYSVAEAFLDAVNNGLSPKTDRIYIPILWGGCYQHYREAQDDPIYRTVPAVQEFLDKSLDPNERYFTVTRCDDGLYETIPDNVLVFGSCSNADIQIPLTCNGPFSAPLAPSYLASFVGARHSGGSKSPPGKVSFADWDPNGIGTQVRTKMWEAFGRRDDCLLLDTIGGSGKAWEVYGDIMCRTKYALAPRGYAPTSFRLYEAMAFSTVPVYISDIFFLPYIEQLDWGKFCVLCPPDKLDTLPERLENIPEKWRAEALRSLPLLWREFFSLDGTCKQIARYLEGGA